MKDVALALSGLGRNISLDVAQVALRAQALPSESGQGRWGGNAGLALEVRAGHAGAQSHGHVHA